MHNMRESTFCTVKHRSELLLPNIAEGYRPCLYSAYGISKRKFIYSKQMSTLSDLGVR